MQKICTPLWREARFQVKILKISRVRTAFRSWDVEKLHVAVARSTFRSQNAKKLTGSGHFLKLGCGEIARRCGAKHIFKSKCRNTPCSDHFLKLGCRKIARRCGVKHISKSKCSKHTRFGRLFEAFVARSTFSSENAQNTPSSDIENLPAVAARHLHFGTLSEVPKSKRCPTRMVDRLIFS